VRQQKFTVFFIVGVILVSLYGMAMPSYDLSVFFDLSRVYTSVRVTVALILLAYVMINQVRTTYTKLFVAISGLLLLTIGSTAFVSPMMLGHLNHYTQIGDVFVAFETGVVCLLAAAELPARKVDFKLPTYVQLYYLRLRQTSVQLPIRRTIIAKL